jgi:hypothetical protein
MIENSQLSKIKKIIICHIIKFKIRFQINKLKKKYFSLSPDEEFEGLNVDENNKILK